VAIIVRCSDPRALLEAICGAVRTGCIPNRTYDQQGYWEFTPHAENGWFFGSVRVDYACNENAAVDEGVEEVEQFEENGEGLFRLACHADLEGIVAKHRYAPYLPEHETTWFKIRNRRYSQWAGREELFEREREREPELRGWEICSMASAAGIG